VERLEFPGANKAAMDFSCTESDKVGLAKNLPFENFYFLAIFLAYKAERVVKVIKFKRNECILE